ncbi:MAG: zinc-ribbon domain-containing protein [Defluviitaleaceae bacterium]|nr:zinc-ribbon domain-containing protein [Defluviitaleaceae bacterium]
MTFCTNCGANMDANSQFCTNCGKTTGAEAAPASLPSPYPPQPNTPYPAIASPYGAAPPPSATSNNRMMRAIVVAIAIILVATMLQGWVTLRIDMSPFSVMGGILTEIVEDFMWDFGMRGGMGGMFAGGNVSYSMTLHELGNYTAMLDWMISTMTSVAMMTDPWAAQAMNAVTAPFSMMSFAVTAIRVLQTLGILGLAGFAFLLLSRSKAAGLVGQLATLVIFITSLVFIIAMMVINSSIGNMMNMIGGGMMGMGFGMNLGISFVASIWVWFTLLLSAAGFSIITLRKNSFR